MAIIAAVSSVALLGVLAVSSSAGAAETGPPPKDWRDADAPRRIRAYAHEIEKATGWAGLGDFLAAVAYSESRGNPDALGDGGGAHGWFQLHTGSWCLKKLGMSAAQVVAAGERFQVVAAACHVYRLGTIYDAPGQTVRWGDIRRGWKFPGHVKPQYADTAQGRQTAANFRRGLRAVGVPTSHAGAPALPPGFHWEGVQALLNATAIEVGA